MYKIESQQSLNKEKVCCFESYGMKNVFFFFSVKTCVVKLDEMQAKLHFFSESKHSLALQSNTHLVVCMRIAHIFLEYHGLWLSGMAFRGTVMPCLQNDQVCLYLFVYSKMPVSGLILYIPSIRF